MSALNLPRRRQSVDQLESINNSEETATSSQTEDASSFLSRPGSTSEGSRFTQNLLHAESPVAPQGSAMNPYRRRQSVGQLATIEDDGEKASEEQTGDTNGLSKESGSEPEHAQHRDSQQSQTGDVHDHQGFHSNLRQGRGFNSGSFEEHRDPARSYDGPQDIWSSGSRATISSWATTSDRTFTGSSVPRGRLHSEDSFEEYNRLANHHHLAALSVEELDSVWSEHRPYKTDERSGSGGSTESASKARPERSSLLSRCMNKLRRVPSKASIGVKEKLSLLKSKKSVGALSEIVPKVIATRPKDILKDQSLKDVCKLGGLSTLELPAQFAALECFAVPTSHNTIYDPPPMLIYLTVGRTAPGIFRLGASQETVKRLYNFYANEDVKGSFNGHLENVIATVGSGTLPSWLEYTVHDVASLFKKIILGLRGGLLGSLWLFHAIHDIEQNLLRKPDQSETEFVALKARLIALAISSITSDQRYHLICAVLGLASLIGHETQKAKAQPSSSSPPAGLMTYSALSVVLGPLLLGDAVNDLPSSNPPPTVADQKLGQSPEHQEAGRKLRLAADILEVLLRTWQDVVKQMRDLNMNGTEVTKHGKSTQRLPSASKYTLSSSEDGAVRAAQSPVIKGSDAVRRGESTQGQPSGESMYALPRPKEEPAKKPNFWSRFSSRPEPVSKTGTLSESSSQPSQGVRPSDSSSDRIWFHDELMSDDAGSRESAPLLRAAGRKSQMLRQLHTPRPPRVQIARHSRTPSKSRSHERDRQAMHLPDKTVLPHPYVSEQPSTRVSTPLYETYEQREGGSSSDAPISNYESLLEPEEKTEKVVPTRVEAAHGAFTSGSGVKEAYHNQRVGASHPVKGEHDLLPSNAQSPGKPCRGGQGSPSRLVERDSTGSTGPNQARTMAQHPSGPNHGHYVPDTAVHPIVHAAVHALPSETQSSVLSLPENDNLPSRQRPSNGNAQARESLIPKPVHEAGRGHGRGKARETSPSKETTPGTSPTPTKYSTLLEENNRLRQELAQKQEELNQALRDLSTG
ncbi:MAG: hypothetical protein Q9191_003945 [Dirinaria sp. TL-2023a]